MEQKTLEIGDKILIQNVFMKHIVEIERVTKTKAITKPYNSSGARYEFKRFCDYDYKIYLFSPVKWDTTTRKLIKTI